jgi:restriction system protein
LADQFNLTPEERAQLLPSGVQGLFANRVHWAKFYLSKAGLIESTRRGYFKLTPEGKKVIAKNPERVDNTFLSQFEAFEKFRQRRNRRKHTTKAKRRRCCTKPRRPTRSCVGRTSRLTHR